VCPPLPAEPKDQDASGVLYEGVTRLLRPGASYPGVCVGQNFGGDWANAPRPETCQDFVVITDFDEFVTAGEHKARVMFKPASGTYPTTPAYLNMTFAQDILTMNDITTVRVTRLLKYL
jgi:hypothetical protein